MSVSLWLVGWWPICSWPSVVNMHWWMAGAWPGFYMGGTEAARVHFFWKKLTTFF